MTLRTVLEIAGNYPDNIQIDSCKQENGKYASFAYLLRDGQIHRLMVSTNALFDSKEDANKVLKDFCENCLKHPLAQ
ncbi:hypothetical protein GOQ04_14895 [Emticicia sp. ODNR4P]|nr:hypothetical protein [Emticicia sp. ODNR4P]